jgi:3-hydroxymyristoyl/3-hydroxydecanoyl-(acyl carrier protein) dehydratase
MWPLLKGFDREDVVTWHQGMAHSAGQFCGAVAALSSTLPAVGHALNLCERGPTFMLASAAAWHAGQTIVLPPDRLPHSLERLRAAHGSVYCLCDTPHGAAAAQRAGLVAVDVQFRTTEEGAWPPPAIADTLDAVILYTSGSTGAAQPHTKTWGELVAGAGTLMASFGQPARNAAILGTVSPQHMFGLETTIMWPLQSGTPLLPRLPLYPGDLQLALHEARAFGRDRVWLLTTPLQLKAFHAAFHSTSGVARIITATMPMPAVLAAQVQRDWNVDVAEIYGCTEGGVLAWRRPATNEPFTVAAGIRIAIDAEGIACASGGHLRRPLRLSDRLHACAADPAGTQRFLLGNRDGDLVKTGGKRASLAGLTQQLCSLDGIADGAFFLPTSDAPRPGAAVVAPGMTAAQVRTALAAVIDPAFLPRPLLLVDALPRGAAMKVSLAGLRALVQSRQRCDQADAAPGANHLTARVAIPPTHPALRGHFPGRPLVPGVVLLQHLETLLGAHGYRFEVFRSVKFHAPVSPAQEITLDVRIASDGGVRFSMSRDGTCVAEGVCQCVRAAEAS